MCSPYNDKALGNLNEAVSVHRHYEPKTISDRRFGLGIDAEARFSRADFSPG